MTMTSDQCDELHEKAKLLRGYVDGLSAPYVMPSTKELMALTMLDSAGRMEQAADIILELRDDLQRANEAVRDAEHDESMAWDRVRKTEAENGELRALCKSMRCALAGYEDKVYLVALDKSLVDAGFDLQKLGIEV